MKDFIGQISQNPSCCPDVDLKTRIVGFIITFILGLCLLFMSLGALGGVFLGSPAWFALLYTIGNITSLSSSFFLVGPKKQFKNMLLPTRMAVSIIFLVSMVMTLVSVFALNSKLLIIIFCAIQFCALLWYVMSYIPYGRKFCTNWLKSCCCCKGVSEGKDEPIL